MSAHCNVPSCQSRASRRGVCSSHYIQWREHRDHCEYVDGALVPGQNDNCNVPECSRDHYGRGLCKNHYSQWAHTGKHSEYVREGSERPEKMKHPLYSRWNGMKSRCGSLKSYEDVAVCQSWRDSFWQFARDVGLPPTSDHSLDRIDPTGDYEPSNVRWATPEEQSLNKRVNTHFSPEDAKDLRNKFYGDPDVTMAQIEREYDISHNYVRNVLRGRTYPEAGGHYQRPSIPIVCKTPIAEPDADTIRESLKTGRKSRSELADEYGTTPGNIQRIASGSVTLAPSAHNQDQQGK